MSNAMATRNGGHPTPADDPILNDEKLWQVVSSGDLRGLSPKQKSDYYLYRCRVEGLNPASQPFQYVTFQGKEILYGGKTAADQLRKLHGISITAVACRDDGEYIECEVRVRDREGREDFETGVVFVGATKGVERANAKMKCLTKAKRRATYSICGTGVLDETEVETIPEARRVAFPDADDAPELAVARRDPAIAPETAQRPVVRAEVVDRETGEITEPQETKAEIDAGIAAAAGVLGMTFADAIKEARRLGLPATLDGRRQLRNLLAKEAAKLNEGGGDEAKDAEDAAAGRLIDAAYAVAGEAGADTWTA